MIIDFSSLDTPSEYRSRICVIGSGPVGLSIVAEFLNSPKIDVIVVESGALSANSKNDTLNELTNTGDAESGLAGSRARVFGGTSTLWGGQAIPLSSLDFEQRPWVQNSGWPFHIGTLSDYFRRAAKILEIDGADFDLDIWQKNSGFKKDIDQEKLRLTFSRWSPAPDFSKTYLKTIEKSQHVKILVNANVTELESSKSGTSVKSAVIKSLPGHTGRVRADIFILCCGGIENPRILLNSKSFSGDGLGNQYGNVGKFFQDHVAYYGARLIPMDFKKFVSLFSSYFNKNQMYLPKLQLSERLQTENKALNVIGNVGVEYTKDSAVALKRLFNDLKSKSIDKGTFNSLAQVMKDPIDSGRLILSYGLSRRMYYPRKADYFLIANCETEPAAESAVSLDSELDALGVPKAKVNWAITNSVKQSLLLYLENVREELDRLGIAQAIIKPSLYEESDAWKSSIFSIYHHIGTTRISDSSESGVVDSSCKVHGVENLYIGGSSVFPTSGAANPTFTAMALSLRLADHLKSIILSGDVVAINPLHYEDA